MPFIVTPEISMFNLPDGYVKPVNGEFPTQDDAVAAAKYLLSISPSTKRKVSEVKVLVTAEVVVSVDEVASTPESAS